MEAVAAVQGMLDAAAAILGAMTAPYSRQLKIK